MNEHTINKALEFIRVKNRPVYVGEVALAICHSLDVTEKLLEQLELNSLLEKASDAVKISFCGRKDVHMYVLGKKS